VRIRPALTGVRLKKTPIGNLYKHPRREKSTLILTGNAQEKTLKKKMSGFLGDHPERKRNGKGEPLDKKGRGY